MGAKTTHHIETLVYQNVVDVDAPLQPIRWRLGPKIETSLDGERQTKREVTNPACVQS